MTEIQQQIENRGRALAKEQGALELLESQHEQIRCQREATEQELLHHQGATKLLQLLVESLYQDSISRIERLVSGGLRAVYGQADWRFYTETSVARNAVSMRFLLESDTAKGKLTTDLYESEGGGLVDVASFLLRTIVLVLYRPTPARILLLDESFRCVSRKSQERVATLLRQLCEKLNMQIILVTHSPELAEGADILYNVRKSGDETRFTVEREV